MKKKFEFSKAIFVYIAILFTVVILFTMVLMWVTKDTSAIAYLIPAVGGLMATTVGFYAWKAKAENILKIQQNPLNNINAEDITNTVEELLKENDCENAGGDYYGN